MLIRVAALLAVLRQRTDPSAAAFLDAYAAFVREVMTGEPEGGAYRQWIRGMIAKRGYYLRCRNEADIDRRLQRSRDLIASVSQHGVKHPIMIWHDEAGVEIDGWHRTVIASVCGIELIPCRVRTGYELPPELAGAVV